MKTSIFILFLTVLYSLLWYPFILPAVEPRGSGGFASTLITIMFGIVFSIFVTARIVYLIIQRKRAINIHSAHFIIAFLCLSVSIGVVIRLSNL